MDFVAKTRLKVRNRLSVASTADRIRCMSSASRPPARPVQLDDVSKAIIEQLQADGRRSYAEIGKAVGLSEAAVRQRVQKLSLIHI